MDFYDDEQKKLLLENVMRLSAFGNGMLESRELFSVVLEIRMHIKTEL